MSSAWNGRIAIDFDDTLFPFVPNFLPLINGYLGTSVSMNDLHMYDLTSVFRVSRIQLDDLFSEFIYNNKESIYYAPIQGSLNALSGLHSCGVDLYIVTAREARSSSVTEAYLDKWFPGIFTDVIYKDSSMYGTISFNKMRICGSIKASYLVDDNALNLQKPFRPLSVAPVLFGEYPWNASCSTDSWPTLKSWSDYRKLLL